MNIFFCDIIGTFKSKNSENRIQALKNFVDNLNNIIAVDHLDKLYFSFISSNHMEDVLMCVKELMPFIDNNKIIFGAQFSSKHIFIDGERKRYDSCKASQMMKFLDHKDIKNIYYADDTNINHTLFEHTIKKLHPEINIESFIPGTFKMTENAIGIDEKGLSGLNKLLKIYVEGRKEFDDNEVLNRHLQ